MTKEELEYFSSIKRLGNKAMETFIESIDEIMEKLSPEDKLKLTTKLLSVHLEYQKNLCLLIENSRLSIGGQDRVAVQQ